MTTLGDPSEGRGVEVVTAHQPRGAEPQRELLRDRRARGPADQEARQRVAGQSGGDDLRSLQAKVRGDWDVIGWWQESSPRWAARLVSPSDFAQEAVRA